MRITKREWSALGGLRNPNLYRRMVSGVWCYYKLPDPPSLWEDV